MWQQHLRKGHALLGSSIAKFSVSPTLPQVHAEHYRRAIGVCGGLPVWPGGNAPGGQREPAALPRGLRSQWLGPLEPLQPGEGWTQIRKRAAARLSATVQIRERQICAKPAEIYLDIFFMSEFFSLSEAQGIQSVAALYYCEQCMNLCQQVISHPPRRNKRDVWAGKQEENGLYITFSILHCTHCCAFSEEERWPMVKTRSSWAGFQIYIQQG